MHITTLFIHFQSDKKKRVNSIMKQYDGTTMTQLNLQARNYNTKKLVAKA